MRELTLPNSLYLKKAKKMSRTALESSLERWKRALVISIVLGGFFGVVGMTLGMMSLLEMLGAYRFLDSLGTAFLVIAFPLVVFAAHCLDKAHEIEKVVATEYCRRTGIVDR